MSTIADLMCFDPQANREPDYAISSFTFTATDAMPEWQGDGSSWVFDRTTVQPDITPYELAQILSIHIKIVDGMARRIKADPALARHFRHEP